MFLVTQGTPQIITTGMPTFPKVAEILLFLSLNLQVSVLQTSIETKKTDHLLRWNDFNLTGDLIRAKTLFYKRRITHLSPDNHQALSRRFSFYPLYPSSFSTHSLTWNHLLIVNIFQFNLSNQSPGDSGNDLLSFRDAFNVI